ncbi:MAG: zinc-ribbon domain-containing protein [Prevotella sp.]|nr:zinc-ribbon domain-containing protein [Prevotella sp.]
MRNLLKDNIELMKEYNYAKNVDLDLDKITIGTKKKIWWKCTLGHEWQSAVGSRSNGVGCPYCSNRKVLRGYNDLASTNPNVANEWDYEKNIGLLPTMISSGSNKKVWWKCSLGHEWQAVVVERAIRGTGCPYCANQKVLVGFNDLATTNPAIASEWDYSKNQELLPTMVPPGSLKRVWWKCSLGHEWQEIIEKRAIRGYGCPVCSGHKVLAGYNDLATVYPDVAKEWHPTKNTDISPCEVTPFSGRKVWWICRKGHEWQATICDRTSKRTGCPICNQELKTSFPEQAILFYCRMLTSAESRNTDYGKEIDIYLPKYRTGIEHNGRYYHKDKQELDEKKIAFFAQKGIRIISIIESDKNSVYDNTIEYRLSSNKESLNWAIGELLELIGFKNIDIDVERDAPKIYEQYIIAEKANSLVSINPKIANQWNYEKNGLLAPDLVSSASGKKVWWKCDKGHEWQATVNDRKKGYGCPFCAGRMVQQGYNDLETTHTSLALEWHPTKNEELLPSMVSHGSSRKVWWICSKGHEWKMEIAKRCNGYGCPYCSGQAVLQGFNDLSTVNPTLAKEWHPTKNGEISPTMVSRGSSRKVWWICSMGHEWQATIGNRSRGSGCPYCSGNKVMPGFNDLATSNPVLAAEWNTTRNGDFLPSQVTPKSGKKVWWLCKNGHEWQAKVSSRANGSGCPYCSGHRVLED